MSIVIIDGQQYKECSKCNDTKKIPEGFSRNSRNKDGFEYRCKTCISGYHKERRKTGKTGSSSPRRLRQKKDGIDYFTKLGLTSFIEGFTKVYEKARDEYLCEVKSPYREYLSSMFKKIFDEGVVPVIQSYVPSQHILKEEITKLREMVERKSTIIEQDKEQIHNLYQKLGKPHES